MQGFRRLQNRGLAFTALLFAFAVLGPSGTPAAGTPEPLGKPLGQVLLTVAGEIERGNAKGGAAFDRAMLEALGVRELATSTPWTEGTPVFRGVLLSDLLNHLGAKGTAIRALALNDYRCLIERSDVERYPVLIAFEMNGQALSVRDKGPLWIVYPRDQFSELQDRATERKMIWQLKELVVQ